MVDRDKIQFDLIKLAGGGRILRLTEPQSGLALEKKLAPADASSGKRENFSARLKRRWRGLNWRRRNARFAVPDVAAARQGVQTGTKSRGRLAPDAADAETDRVTLFRNS